MKPDIKTEPCIPTGQATRMVGVSGDALEALTENGVLEPARTPSGRVLYRPVDIEKAREHFAKKARA
jgi:DNA-binding transcriptional MerR regulator